MHAYHGQRINRIFGCFGVHFRARTDGRAEFLDQSDRVNATKDLKGPNHLQAALPRNVKGLQREHGSWNHFQWQGGQCLRQQLTHHRHRIASYDRAEASSSRQMLLGRVPLAVICFWPSQKVCPTIASCGCQNPPFYPMAGRERSRGLFMTIPNN
jgi:hypothetical protein